MKRYHRAGNRDVDGLISVPPQIPAQDEGPEPFLLQELGIIENEIQRLRGEGTSRINFLLTLTTAIITAIVALSAVPTFPRRSIITLGLGASAFMLLVGLITLRYIAGREAATDMDVRANGRIRHYFVDRYPEIKQYMTWQTTDAPTAWVTQNRSFVRRVQIVLCGLYASGVAAFGLASFSTRVGLMFQLAIAALAFVLTYALAQLWCRHFFSRLASKARAQQRFFDD